MGLAIFLFVVVVVVWGGVFWVIFFHFVLWFCLFVRFWVGDFFLF